MPLQIDDELFPEAAQAVQEVAEKCEIPVLLVGAYARDLLLEALGVARTPRRTCDVDFGVKADSWDEFQRLKDALDALSHLREGLASRLVRRPEDPQY